MLPVALVEKLKIQIIIRIKGWLFVHILFREIIADSKTRGTSEPAQHTPREDSASAKSLRQNPPRLSLARRASRIETVEQIQNSWPPRVIRVSLIFEHLP